MENTADDIMDSDLCVLHVCMADKICYSLNLQGKTVKATEVAVSGPLVDMAD